MPLNRKIHELAGSTSAWVAANSNAKFLTATDFKRSFHGMLQLAS